jgi:uncharacterized protein (DUF433 family)
MNRLAYDPSCCMFIGMNFRDIPIPLRDYFEQTPDVLSGKLRLHGTRVSIEQILELLESGVALEEIVRSFPSVTLSAVAAVERLAAHCALAVVR